MHLSAFDRVVWRRHVVKGDFKICSRDTPGLQDLHKAYLVYIRSYDTNNLLIDSAMLTMRLNGNPFQQTPALVARQ